MFICKTERDMQQKYNNLHCYFLHYLAGFFVIKMDICLHCFLLNAAYIMMLISDSDYGSILIATVTHCSFFTSQCTPFRVVHYSSENMKVDRLVLPLWIHLVDCK